jgi:hypothetical protein
MHVSFVVTPPVMDIKAINQFLIIYIVQMHAQNAIGSVQNVTLYM